MTAAEKFCLKWNDFQENIATAYREIRESEDFTDVTLVCEEDKQIETHRVILSACSPFFMRVLKKNKHSHPMIYMKGFKLKYLMSIIDFIYYGEANIFQEDLNEFLAMAEDLQLKGLTGSSKEETKQTEEESFESANAEQSKPLMTPRIKPRETKSMLPKEEVIGVSVGDYGIMAIQGTSSPKITVGNVTELDQNISTMIEKIESSGEWGCTVCGKTSKVSSNIRQHIEAHHIEGMGHPCDQCGKVSRSRHALARHIFMHHKK